MYFYDGRNTCMCACVCICCSEMFIVNKKHNLYGVKQLQLENRYGNIKTNIFKNKQITSLSPICEYNHFFQK